MPMQVSISGQALVFVVRTQGYSLFSRAGLWTYIAFFGAQARLVLPAASIAEGNNAPIVASKRVAELHTSSSCSWHGQGCQGLDE